jgi:hypothetical protein
MLGVFTKHQVMYGSGVPIGFLQNITNKRIALTPFTTVLLASDRCEEDLFYVTIPIAIDIVLPLAGPTPLRRVRAT